MNPALEPSLVVLSTLGSLPFAVYCIRFIGAAALRMTRDERHVLVAVRLDARWASVLFRFLVASIIAGAAVWTFDSLRPGMFAANHGVFAAVLVGSIWPHATHLTSRALLLAYLACIAFALVTTGADVLAGIAASYAVGFGAVALTARLQCRRA